MDSNKDKLAVAIRDKHLPHKHNLTNEHANVISKLIGAIRHENKERILEILEPWSDELKDKYLSISCKYLLDQNIPISYNISEFVSISLLKLRFYFPGVEKQLQPSKANKTNILKYMMKHMDAILIWKGPTDKILLYHIKQVVLMANEVKYLFRSETEQLPWFKLIFCCVQYIKYFNTTNYRKSLTEFMSNDKLINYIQLWKIGLENMNSKKIMQDQDIQYMLQDFEYTYDYIRDKYVVKRMKRYCSVQRSFLSNLRMLQVIGECLKSTDQNSNISLRLKEHFKSHLGTDYKNLIKLRGTISNLTGIPQCNQYVIKQVAKLTRTMESTLRKNSDSIFNEFDSGYDSDSDNNIYDSQVDLIKTINQEIIDAPKLSYNDCLKQLEDALNHNKEQGEIEMLLMIILNNLNQEQGRLNANRKWFMEKYPTLTGRQLRNHLAHGDPIVELMDVDIKMAARHTATMLIEELNVNDENKEKIEMVTRRPAIEVMQEFDYQQITHLEEQEKLFLIIMEGDLEKFKDYLKNISSEWINWHHLRKKNALQYAAANKNDNLELFQFIFEKSSNYMKQIKTDSSLLFQALRQNNFKIAKRIAELHICALLENDRTYLQPNDNNDILELCKKLIKTEKINSFWNVCYYQISCDYLNNLKLMLDEIYERELRVSSEMTSWFQIAYTFNAKKVMKYLINIGYTILYHKDYPNIINQEMVKYCDIEKHKELRKIIKSGQVFKEKECVKKSPNMLEQCHDDDFNVMNSLHFAIKSGNPEMVKQVYQCLPVLLFTMDNDGNSPLDVAIEQNRVQEFNILMELVVNNALKLPQLFKTWAIKIINLHKSNIFRNNNVVVENVLTNTINAMDMNPKEKTVQYWAIKLAKSMLGYYNSNEHLINIWEQIAINTLFHFPDESPIVKQCIGYVVEIFDHKLSAEPKYNIEYELESILKRCARYSHPSVILEKLNIALKNKIEYEHWIKRITHHAKYAIDTFRDDPLIQPYASKLMYYLKKSESNSSVNDPFPQTFLKIVPSASKEFQLTSSKPMKSEETDNKIKCDWLTYLVKIPFLPYNSKLRNEEVHAIRELISAIQEDRKDNILQIMDSFKTDSKDELLAMAATYLNDQHFKIPKEVAKFINTTLLTYRFYTNYTIPIPPKSNLLESEKEGRLEYLIQQMNIILEWPGSNNQVLMYHIKQVIFHADYVEFWHRSVLPELPWIQLKFYLQQYIKYFTSKDEIHLYQIGLISQKELTKIINLFRTMLLCVKNKKDSSKIKLTSEDKTIIEEFKKIYHEIRDVYVLYRICHYVESNEKKNGLTILRIVQVIGKCLKNSDKTPNVSDCLLEHIKEYFFEEEIAGIIRLSDNISHLTSIPNCTERIQTIFDKTLNDISKCFIHIKINYIYKECNDRIKKFIKGPTEIGDLPNFYKVTHKNLIDDILSREPSKQKRSKIQHNINIHLLQSVITSEGENIPEYKDDLMQLRKLQNKTNGYMEMELILMIILNNLNKKQKRLNNNLEWFKEMYPTLTGQQLRNHLAHGDPIVELLRIDEEVAVRDTAKLLTAEIANSSKFVIQKITKALKLDQMEEININQRNKIEQMENLFEYIIEGNLERVKTLLDNIQDKWVDWCDKNEHNVLEITAQNKKDNVKLFEFVLNQNSNFMNDINKYGNSILQIASMAGNTNITKYILEKNIMALYEQEKLPRISESITDVNKLLTELIKTTRTIKPKQQNAWNAIAQYVICLNNEDTIKSVTKLFYYSLLDCPLDNNLNTYLHIACIHGAEKVVQYLIKIGYNLNCRNIHKDTPLSLAIHHKRDNIIRLLLNKGAIVFNVNNITESIKILFNAPNYDEHEQLWDIIKSGKVEDLNENMIAPSRLEDGRNCLHFAVESNNSVMIQRIYDEYPHLLVTYDLQLITPLNLVISKNNESLHKCILDLVFKEYRGNEIVQSELFKNVVKTLMKTSNDKIAEVVMNKILDVVNMYPDDKFFNYWIINLVNHYFKTINEYGTDKVKICLNLVKNGIRNFTEKQIIEQCICLFVNIFINNSQWENNHISDTFNYLLEEGKNKNRLFILECLNNQFDSANLENISDFKYELISKYSYIVHAIRNKESVSKIQ